ncbi:hypothetical protein AOQ84DRAFT_390548, partial [Glonium stellatum]
MCLPDAVKDTPPTFFKPPDNVIQKVSKDGKKYLQIIADGTTSTQQIEILQRTSSNNEYHKQRLSVTFSETTDTVSTDELDTWLSTFSLQKQEEELQFEKSKEKSAELIKETHGEAQKERDGSLGENRGGFEGCDQKALKSSHIPFGLHPVEQPRIAVTYSEAPDVMAALFSNPPSTRQSTADGLDSSLSTNDGKDDSDNGSLPDFPQPPYSEENRNSFERGSERLAGQGMRRPSPEQGKSAIGRSDSPSKDSTSDNGRTREDSGVGRMPHADPSAFGLGAKDSTRKSREERIRARKLRDLQRTRNNIDEVLEQHADGVMLSELVVETAPTATSTEKYEVELESLKETQPRLQRENRLQDDSDTRHPSVDTLLTASTPGYSTGYTPASSNMSLTPIMLVAEQIPTSKPKAAKKPARLILRDRHTLKPLAIAVREAMDPAAETAPMPAPSSSIDDALKERSGSGPATASSAPPATAATRRTEQEERDIAATTTLSRVPSQNPLQAFSGMELALQRRGSVSHRSAPALLPTAAAVSLPAAITATPTTMTPASPPAATASTSASASASATSLA